ncbi:MAG: hypothetical protein HZB51_03170 [Chloroflexi bacterium]|nr:hypothetical protein [Chloroflexota bacterium]
METSPSTNPAPKIILAAGIVVLLIVVGYGIYRISHSQDYTVSEVWRRRNELKGQHITVRGYLGYAETQITLQRCVPQRCDCNTSSAKRIGLFGESTLDKTKPEWGIPPKYLVLEILDCRGDACMMGCQPIDPGTIDELEFAGVLRIAQEETAYPYLILDDVQLENAGQKINGIWQAIPIGVYSIQLPQQK